MSSPEDIERGIERTRESLRTDVDALSEKVSPARVVERRVTRVKGAATSMKERVMGATESGASSIGDAASSAASSIGDAASAAPAKLRTQTQGSPLAAGLVAFGVGYLASALIPASQREQQLGSQVQEHAADIAAPLKESAQEVAQKMQEPLQESVQEVKSTISEAASNTADQASSAVDEVKRTTTS